MIMTTNFIIFCNIYIICKYVNLIVGISSKVQSVVLIIYCHFDTCMNNLSSAVWRRAKLEVCNNINIAAGWRSFYIEI